MKNKWRNIFRLLSLVLVLLCCVGCRGKEDEMPGIEINTGADKEVDAEVGAEADKEVDTETDKETDKKPEVVSKELKLENGISILGTKSYAGQFMEDGTDEIVSNVLLLQIRNDGKEAIQLADLIVTDEAGGTYNFRITVLMPGKEMTLLELNRAEYKDDMKIASVNTENLVYFSEVPSMNEDVFEISCENNLILVKNISNEVVKEGRVCYKNISGEIYIGGITYTVGIPEMQPGEEAQLLSRHYTKGASELVFVTYTN